jgi:hypothetical protein
MFKKLQQALVWLASRAGEAENVKAVRTAAVMMAKLFRNPAKVPERLRSFRDTIAQHSTETASWVSSDEMIEKGGPFDSCDLRHWVALAEAAGVPFIPAVEVLKLTESEMEFLSGTVSMPNRRPSRSADDAAVLEKNIELVAEIVSGLAASGPPVGSREELVERLYAAMDGVPEGWMVRNIRAGSLELKTLAGAGAAGPEVPEVRFGPDVEVGPGWVRNGNRRRVNVSDHRTLQSVAQGPGGGTSFVARPWVEAARYIAAEDPHRHGTQFAGKGYWPAEWRAFVEDGEVVGVAFYYGWTGSVTSRNAAIALEVRDLAQRVVDEAARRQAWPRTMDVEFVRASRHPDLVGNDDVQHWLGVFGRETVSCTLDFLETENGPVLLEGGPPNTPFGGGHPCAFAGHGGPPRFGSRTLTYGVAFSMMEDVLLGDPKTWRETDPENHVLSWGEVEALASMGFDDEDAADEDAVPRP